jgi:hypothetical protein
MPLHRAPYSSAFDFITLRDVDLGEDRIGPGEPFPRDAVSERRLFLLYEARWIEPLVPGYRDPRAGRGPHDLVPADHYTRQAAAAELHPGTPPIGVPQPAPALPPPGDGPAEPGVSQAGMRTAKHLGFGKWAVVAGEGIVHPGPLTREEAEALAAE